ncbi:hypothetical protein P4S72_20745 [Vibrio sp. PP-XX7]
MIYAMELCRLTRHFDIKKGMWKEKTRLTAVNDVSLRIHSGEVVGLVGESRLWKKYAGENDIRVTSAVMAIF